MDIMEACRVGDIKFVSSFFSSGQGGKLLRQAKLEDRPLQNVFNHYTNEKMETLLMVAMNNGDERKVLAVVSRLVELGIPIDAENRDCETALVYALRNKHFDVAEYLVKNGARITYANRSRESMLSMMTRESNYRAVRFLVECGSDINACGLAGVAPIVWTALEPNFKEFMWFVEHGALLDTRDSNGNTVLQAVLWNTWMSGTKNPDQMNAIKYILSHIDKATLDSRNKCGETALSIACQKRLPDIVELLLENGRGYHDGSTWCADSNIPDNSGRTPLILMAQERNTMNYDHAERRLNIVKHLVELSRASGNPCNMNAVDATGQTALIHAVNECNDDIVEYLVGNAGNEISGKDPFSCDINTRDKYKNTPLILAVAQGRTDIAERLLGIQSCDINAKNEEGRTAIVFSIIRGNEYLTRKLVNAGANLTDPLVTFAIRSMPAKPSAGPITRCVVTKLIGDSLVPYEKAPISFFIPRRKGIDSSNYADLVKFLIPKYFDRIVRDPKFGMDALNAVEKMLSGIVDVPANGTKLTKKDVDILEKIRKTIKTIDYTDRTKPENDENSSSTYDMEL